jgi:TPR repeat protein
MRSFLLLLLFPVFAFAVNCRENSWVSGPVISEENEWFFFRGESTDMDLEFAMTKARGMALDRLVNNCEKIPKQTKILKLCKERVGAGIQVFVQAAIYNGDCFKIKIAKPEEAAALINQDLSEEYNYYLEKIVKNYAPVNLECGPSAPKNCAEKGAYFFDLAVYPKALEFLEYSCDSGDLKSCLLGGISSFLIKEQDASISLFRKTCKKEESSGCLFLGVIYELLNNNKLAQNNFIKSCFLENPRGCLFLGELLEQLNNGPKALKSFHSSCLMNSGEGCEMAYRKLSAYPEVAEIFGHKACILKREGVCFGLGLKKLENKKLQDALKFFKRSCDLGLAMGCRQTGEMVRVKSLKKSIDFFDSGCDLGDLPSCLTLSRIFEKDPSKLGYYSMMGCVLGDLNSCFLWGRHLVEKQDIQAAKKILNVACEKGQPDACKLGRRI